ncbi:MAG: sulfate adenylyltransferase subunit CysN [Polyangiaceae bacterium]|jgi:bifunctional enzyme CysN/CysC|nr:sulfate adenylyltransferase subunit CysN [Polyangiaceae bacterium]
MAHVSELIAQDIEGYLRAHEHKGLLRFITCGSVDDGKSTLIGRLLYESKMIFEDQLAALEADSKKVGTQGGELDFALLVDGLAAEREQGITIDVAYRFFSTDRRKFIVADTPGHEQYTRNMITGASTAQVAVVMIDARKGVLTQTRRHSFLVSLIGIRKIVLAINKLDMVGYSREVFDRIEADYRAFAARLGLTDITCIPMSALRGDNVTSRSENTPWYTGPALMEFLETVPIEEGLQDAPFRLLVQWVNRPNLDFRGFSGLIVGGQIKPGDRVKALPSGKESVVTRVVTMDGDLPVAMAGQSITVTLADEIDISRGDVLASVERPAGVAEQLEATLVWMSEQPLEPGRSYLLKLGSRLAGATVKTPRHKINVNTLEETPTAALELNEIGVCELTLDRPVAFDPYTEGRDMGGFILIDRLLNTTIAAGLIRSGSLVQQRLERAATRVDRAARAALKGQKAAVVWLDGPRAEGLAAELERRLFTLGRHTYLLSTGDQAPREAALLADAGLLVLAPRPGEQERCAIALSPPFGAEQGALVPGPLPDDPAEAAQRLVEGLRALGALDALDLDPGDGI